MQTRQTRQTKWTRRTRQESCKTSGNIQPRKKTKSWINKFSFLVVMFYVFYYYEKLHRGNSDPDLVISFFANNFLKKVVRY